MALVALRSPDRPSTPVVPRERVDPDFARRQEEARRRAEQVQREAQAIVAGMHRAHQLLDALAAGVEIDEPGPTLGDKRRRVLRETALLHRVSQAEILGKSRKPAHVAARHHFIFRLIDDLKLSTPQAGRYCGGRDHTTAMHAYRAHLARVQRGEVPQ